MSERQKDIIGVVFLEKDENVIAYCPGCQKPVWTGNDRGIMGLRNLKDRVWAHIYSGKNIHEVDIIYPRRSSEQIIGGETFVANGADFTIFAEVFHKIAEKESALRRLKPRLRQSKAKKPESPAKHTEQKLPK